MLSILHKNGFKKSCLISFNKWLIEINDTGKMETIVDNSLSYEYIERLVEEANKRLEKTKNNIKKLEKLFS
jgi:tRNA(Phe) wybutosine-synthesizing methylase Tyw3